MPTACTLATPTSGAARSRGRQSPSSSGNCAGTTEAPRSQTGGRLLFTAAVPRAAVESGVTTEPPSRIELETYGLRNRCSTPELGWRNGAGRYLAALVSQAKARGRRGSAPLLRLILPGRRLRARGGGAGRHRGRRRRRGGRRVARAPRFVDLFERLAREDTRGVAVACLDEFDHRRVQGRRSGAIVVQHRDELGVLVWPARERVEKELESNVARGLADRS